MCYSNSKFKNGVAGLADRPGGCLRSDRMKLCMPLQAYVKHEYESLYCGHKARMLNPHTPSSWDLVDGAVGRMFALFPRGKIGMAWLLVKQLP